MKKNIAAGIATALAGITPALAMSGCNQGQVEEELKFTLGESKTFECSVTPIVSKESVSDYEFSAEYVFTLPGCTINKKAEGKWEASATLTIQDNEYSLEGAVVCDDLDASIVLKTKVLLVEDDIYEIDKTTLPYANPGKYSITKLVLKYDNKKLLDKPEGLDANIGVNFLALPDPDAIKCMENPATANFRVEGKANENRNDIGVANYWVPLGAFWALNTDYTEESMGGIADKLSADITVDGLPSSISITDTNVYAYSLTNFSITVGFEVSETTLHTTYSEHDVNIKIFDENEPTKVLYDSTKDENAPDFIFYLL